MTEPPWTPEQAEAILAPSPVLLAANAGTGKTTTVIGKVLWHLGIRDRSRRDTGEPLAPCPPERRYPLPRIAAITFTEKAAYDLKRQLRERLERHAPELVWDIDRASIGTIHGFCGELLREHALRFGIDPSFRVLDERDARLEHDRIVKDVVMSALADGDEGAIELTRRHNLRGYTFTKGLIDLVTDMFREWRWHPDRFDGWCRDGMLDEERARRLVPEWEGPDAPPLAACATLLTLAQRVLDEWNALESEDNVRDFDSLILAAREILTGEDGAAALAGVRRRLGLLIIDEFQDTDGAQRDIAFAIAGLSGPPDPAGPELFVVGDAKQSIYGFRGADIRVWNQVQDRLCPGGEPMALTENFRSGPAVIDFVNRAGAAALGETARRADELNPALRVDYTPLQGFRPAPSADGVEIMSVPPGRSEARRAEEAPRVAARIRDLVIDPSLGDTEGIEVVDPDTGQSRPCEYRDVAILFRKRAGIETYARELQRYGVPYYLAGDAGLVNRQEVLDLLTLLRVIDNPRDDLSVFGWLRSPFVGLRDETLARIRMTVRGGSLLAQARAFLDPEDWPVFVDRPDLPGIEREALRTGLETLDDLVAMRTRVPVDRLVEDALDRTGYPLHLSLLDQPRPRFANVQRFIRLLQGYRHHTVGSFLELWSHWEDRDIGIPQAPLFSKDDNVVTLSTIHAAKGLEWPVVLFVDTDGRLTHHHTNELLVDPDLGPVLCPRKDERGPRSRLIYDRCIAREAAEEARLLYVATTRARDRLIVTAPSAKEQGHATWLKQARDDTTKVTTEIDPVEIPAPPPEPSLDWLDRIAPTGGPHPLVAPAWHPIHHRTRSATELMTHRRDRDEWRSKYLYGVRPAWSFTAREGGDAGLSARIRGTLVHGVLEQIEEEAELAELLDLAIGTLDEPDLEDKLAAGTEYRRRLEEEIRQVVSSQEWHWYVEGRHYRELSFVHFRPGPRWRVGAFDLYRPDPEQPAIIDFKTHDIDAADAARTAQEYVIQAAVYRRALQATGRDAEVRLHFTRPNVVVAAGGAGSAGAAGGDRLHP